MAAGMGNFRVGRIRPQPRNLESFTRLNECLGDLALIDNRRFVKQSALSLPKQHLRLNDWLPLARSAIARKARDDGATG
jgi:hypothetical protein